MKHIEKHKTLTMTQVQQLHQLFDQYAKYFKERAHSSLLHGDLGADHILVRGTRIVGIIDAADALFGDPLYDIGVLYYGERSGEMLDAIESTCGRFDRTLVKLYAVLAKLWHLTSHDVKKVEKSRRRISNILKTME